MSDAADVDSSEQAGAPSGEPMEPLAARPRGWRRYGWAAAAGLLTLAAMVAGALLLTPSDEPPRKVAARTKAPPPVDPSLYSRRSSPRVVEPEAGVSAAEQALDGDAALTAAEDRAPSDSATGSGDDEYSPEKFANATLADVRRGIALPPIDGPSEVTAIIAAGNEIARKPYIWGGGHGRWQDRGYDCSGSVSYALAAAGLLQSPMASGPLMGWGRPGRGKWITIYSNPGHVFMVVAGLRFDTVAHKRTGSRWQAGSPSTAGYVARHPAGL